MQKRTKPEFLGDVKQQIGAVASAAQQYNTLVRLPAAERQHGLDETFCTQVLSGYLRVAYV